MWIFSFKVIRLNDNITNRTTITPVITVINVATIISYKAVLAGVQLGQD